jgi:RimJ/RimL family protein N-acetyltransferase
MIAPRLETERLLLREFRLDDFEPFVAMLGDPVVTRHIGGLVVDRATAWDKFARAPGFWALLGYGMWIVEDKASGRFAGNVGFGRFERAIDPPLPEIPEMAWVLDEWAQGRGIGHEAVSAAIAWGDAHLTEPRYVCIIAPENAASLRLAGKKGFVETRRSPYKGEETVVLERVT